MNKRSYVSNTTDTAHIIIRFTQHDPCYLLPFSVYGFEHILVCITIFKFFVINLYKNYCQKTLKYRDCTTECKKWLCVIQVALRMQAFLLSATLLLNPIKDDITKKYSCRDSIFVKPNKYLT